MNSTKVIDTIYVETNDSVVHALKLAQKNNVQISMCGQSVGKMSYRINMINFNKVIYLDLKNMTVKVQPGLKWNNLIKYFNNYGMSPSTLQSVILLLFIWRASEASLHEIYVPIFILFL